MTQVERIRKILLAGGSLTQRSALMDFGIMALPRRIADLKELGFPVHTEMKTNPNTGQRFAQYTMRKKVLSVDEFLPGGVYQISNVKNNVFHPQLYDASKGYIVGTGSSRQDVAVVRMSGVPQFIIQDNFDDQDFDVEYVGGLA